MFSVIVTILIGGIETLGLLGGKLGLTGWFWNGIGGLNDNFNGLGSMIIGVFIAAWVGSLLIYRYKKLDDVDLSSAR